MSDPLIQLWTAQAQEARGLSQSELQSADRRFRRRIFIRDITEYLGGGAAIAAFAYIGMHADIWSMQLACLIVIAGMLMLMRNLWVRRPRADDARLAHNGYQHLRGQLTHQRDVLASVSRWYIGPLIPGAVAFIAALFHESFVASGLLIATLASLIAAASLGIACFVVLWLNRRAVRQLDQQITALDDAHHQPHA